MKKVEDYEFNKEDDFVELGSEIENELIEKMKECISKNKIQLSQLLNIAHHNNNKLNFMYGWLYENDISIGGINGSISGELKNYTHTPKMGQTYLPPSCTPEQNMEYAKKMACGDTEAKKKMIMGNLRLAVWAVNKNVPYKIQKAVGIKDLNQAAAIGVMEAVDRFDYKKSKSFSAYAMYLIKSEINKEIANRLQTYRIPSYLVEKVKKMEKVEIELEKNTGKTPLPEEIAEIMKIPVEKVISMQNIRLSQNLLSLDDAIYEKKDKEKKINELSDTDRPYNINGTFIIDGVYKDEHEDIEEDIDKYITLDDEYETGADIDAESRLLQDEVYEILNDLNENEKIVLTEMFGLIDDRCKPIEEIAENMEMSYMRVRDIAAKGLRKLRHPARANRLIGWCRDPVSKNIDNRKKMQGLVKIARANTLEGKNKVQEYMQSSSKDLEKENNMKLNKKSEERNVEKIVPIENKIQVKNEKYIDTENNENNLNETDANEHFVKSEIEDEENITYLDDIDKKFEDFFDEQEKLSENNEIVKENKNEGKEVENVKTNIDDVEEKEEIENDNFDEMSLENLRKFADGLEKSVNNKEKELTELEEKENAEKERIKAHIKELQAKEKILDAQIAEKKAKGITTD